MNFTSQISQTRGDLGEKTAVSTHLAFIYFLDARTNLTLYQSNALNEVVQYSLFSPYGITRSRYILGADLQYFLSLRARLSVGFDIGHLDLDQTNLGAGQEKINSFNSYLGFIFFIF